ncbi:DNA primase [Poseidonocella pacifica]|uniref:DNA primase n=1 Tax=Poseidonocella pacifica TaxID=871651 RepID=A0A1I0V420_9RHOB|nr:DNA primase [Poseidonocella pacifica]SFA70830.1 DNA primase [Poseidonocella pacifica]
MSMPPGFLDELRNRLSMAQVVGRKVMWDTRKSNQAKGDMWAPCPFHHEKTASFHVDDRKGFYHCFGCGAKGDVFGFVQETENVGFMEAVEILAGEAGMQMPQRDPKAKQKQDRAAQLAEVMEQAVSWYRLQLKTGAGSEARAYLEKRGLEDPALEQFEIGFAPPGWQGVSEHLANKGVPQDLILGAGLVREGKSGNRPYDVFRNRIMFPIRDARGRCIAFGGRAIDPDDNAKYLNSSETLLFDKGRNLYNHGPARAEVGKGAPLIVAEGYMDVIALCGAGFGGAVAPLGTAVTEAQLELLWRIAPEPVFALDGDAAGLRAAYRVIDLALPLLSSGRSLRFALMPAGMDPDDLIKTKGAGAMATVLEAAIPPVRLLWQRETEGKVFDSPERKAGLEKALRDATQRIADPSLRQHYEMELKDFRWQLFRRKPQAKSRRGGGKFRPEVEFPRANTKASLLATGEDSGEERLRVAVILATLIATPSVIVEFEDRIEDLPCVDPEHGRLREAILRRAEADPEAFRGALVREIGPDALETLLRVNHVAITPAVRNPGNAELARMTLSEELAKMDARRGLEAEVAEAAEDLAGFADEAVTWRLGQAAQAALRTSRSESQDKAEYDIAENGTRINRDERMALDALLGQIGFTKGRK